MGKRIACCAHLGRVGVTNKGDAGPVSTDRQAVDDGVDEVDAAVVNRIHAARDVQNESYVHLFRASCGQKVACGIRGSFRNATVYYGYNLKSETLMVETIYCVLRFNPRVVARIINGCRDDYQPVETLLYVCFPTSVISNICVA